MIARAGSNVTRAPTHWPSWIAIAIALLPFAHASARAQAQAQAQAQPEPARPPAADTERSVRQSSAHADRVVLVPTAETQPQGTLFLSSYEIVGAGVGYAFSDRVHAS